VRQNSNKKGGRLGPPWESRVFVFLLYRPVGKAAQGKESKNLARCPRVQNAHGLNMQKFFGSFFQKNCLAFLAFFPIHVTIDAGLF
jgi:hypothetical protein